MLSEKALDAAWRAVWAGPKIKEINIGMPMPDIEAAISAYITALVAEGYVIVPSEPTDGMLKAGANANAGPRSTVHGFIYRAMIAARNE